VTQKTRQRAVRITRHREGPRRQHTPAQKWPRSRNLRLRLPAPAKNNGRVQKAIRRVFTALGAKALTSTEIYDWTHPRRRTENSRYRYRLLFLVPPLFANTYNLLRASLWVAQRIALITQRYQWYTQDSASAMWARQRLAGNRMHSWYLPPLSLLGRSSAGAKPLIMLDQTRDRYTQVYASTRLAGNRRRVSTACRPRTCSTSQKTKSGCARPA
jgi:hypothetical protein